MTHSVHPYISFADAFSALLRVASITLHSSWRLPNSFQTLIRELSMNVHVLIAFEQDGHRDLNGLPTGPANRF